ncbi:hypothetical protein PCE1_003718 [Barthelona sp. PCE]
MVSIFIPFSVDIKHPQISLYALSRPANIFSHTRIPMMNSFNSFYIFLIVFLGLIISSNADCNVCSPSFPTPSYDATLCPIMSAVNHLSIPSIYYKVRRCNDPPQVDVQVTTRFLNVSSQWDCHVADEPLVLDQAKKVSKSGWSMYAYLTLREYESYDDFGFSFRIEAVLRNFDWSVNSTINDIVNITWQPGFSSMDFCWDYSDYSCGTITDECLSIFPGWIGMLVSAVVVILLLTIFAIVRCFSPRRVTKARDLRRNVLQNQFNPRIINVQSF